MSTVTSIYMLVDPRTDEIRYVGKSIRPQERLQNHMNEHSNCHRSHWLQELKRANLVPGLVVLETISGEWPWQESERWWIAHLKAMGARLTNNTSGGDGVCDLPPDSRARMRNTWLGRKHTEAARRKMSAKLKLRKVSSDTCAKHSKAMRGRKILWIDKIAATLRKISPETAETIKTRLNAGETVTSLAREFSVHRTTLSKIKTGRYFTIRQETEVQ